MQFVEWYHFRDFLLLFLGSEVAISAIVIALEKLKVIHNATLLAAVGFILYLIIVGRYCVHIYFGERSPKLYFKTALAALAVEGAAAAAAAYFGGTPLIWCFAPMRLLRFLRRGGNLSSVAFSMAVVVLVMAASYFIARFLEKRWYKPEEPRESEEEYRKLTPISEIGSEEEITK